MTTEAAPKAILRGTFSIYETPDGGYHVAYRPDDCDEDKHLQIPGMYVKLMKARMGKKFNLAGLFGAR